MKVLLVGDDLAVGNALARALAVAAVVGIGGLFEPAMPLEIPPQIKIEEPQFYVERLRKRKKPRLKTKTRKR